MNLPIKLTLIRIFLVPPLLVVLLTRVSNFEVWGALILSGAGLTDFLDGHFARRRQQVTSLGALLDPMADKLLIAAAFIALVELGLAPAWMVVIIVGRELAVQGMRMVASAQGFSLAVSELGKTKMALQVVAATLLLLGGPFAGLRPAGVVALWLVVFFAVASAIRYSQVFWREWSRRAEGRRDALLVLGESEARREAKEDVAAH